MKTARLLLTASAALLALVLVAAAWAAPAADDGADSGGARALPVIPSGGGGSEPAPDVSSQLGGTSGELPQTTPLMPPTVGVPGAAQEGTETLHEEGLIVPLDDAGSVPGAEGPQPLGDSSGGGFSFLAATGSEIVSLVIGGVAMVVSGISRSSP